MWSIGFLIRQQDPGVKRSQHGAVWYSVHKFNTTMELKKRYKFVRNKSYAVSVLDFRAL